MTLKQLIGSYSWLNIEATLLDLYPETKEKVQAYENVYQTLLLLHPSETDLQICIEPLPQQQVSQNGQRKMDVSGRTQTPHITHTQLSIPYSLHFTAWSQWLAMPVAHRCMQLFSGTEIIAHCLLEMTAKGFDETTIQAAANQLSQVLNKMDEPGENYGLPFLSWEEILRQLNEKEK